MILHSNKISYGIWAQLLFFIPNSSFWKGCKPMSCECTWEKPVAWMQCFIWYSSSHWLEFCMSVSVQVSVCCTSCVCVCFSETSCVQIMLDSDLSLSDPLSYCTYGVITLYKSHNTACVHSVMYLYVHFVGSCYALHADCTAARLQCYFRVM